MEIVRETDLVESPSPQPSTEVAEAEFLDFGIGQPKFKKFSDLVSAVSACPGDPSLGYQLSVHLVKDKRYETAERVLRSLLRRENCFEVLEALATCLYHLGRWSECAHMARQALMLGEGFRDQRFSLLKYLGNSLIQMRDLDGAREAYEKAFVLFPGSDILQVNFGTLWIQAGDWNQATECFRHALFLNQENDKAWVGIALCHKLRGDSELAFASAERALDVNSMNETAVGLLLDWSRNRAEFAAALERFIEFTDAGGFSSSLSSKFVQRARDFGEFSLAGLEEFHLQLRGEGDHV